jgi:hypothetical protein
MVKLLFAGSLILLVPGCGREPGGAKVSFVETRVDESQSPLPFVIALANSGGDATDVDGVSIDVVDGIVVSHPNGNDDGGKPDTVTTGDCRIEMREGHPTEIAARGDGVACGFVNWDRPQEAPPAVAAVSARFRVKLADGATIETPPRVFLLSSATGMAKLALEELSLDRDEAVALLARVELLPGERTENVDRLVERLRALAK